jgi:hypothetical protein
MEVSWQNQGGVKRLCHDHDPRNYRALLHTFTFRILHIEPTLVVLAGEKYWWVFSFCYISWHIGSIRTPSESIIVKQFI